MSPHLMAHFLTSSGVSEWTNERSAVECPSGASKWVSRVSKWVNKQARGLALTSGFVLVLDHSAQVQHALSFLTVSIKVEVVFLFSLVPLQSTKQWHPRQLGRFGKKSLKVSSWNYWILGRKGWLVDITLNKNPTKWSFQMFRFANCLCFVFPQPTNKDMSFLRKWSPEDDNDRDKIRINSHREMCEPLS